MIVEVTLILYYVELVRRAKVALEMSMRSLEYRSL